MRYRSPIARLTLCGIGLSLVPFSLVAQSVRSPVSSEKSRSVRGARRPSVARPDAATVSYHVIDLGSINTDPTTGQLSSWPHHINQSGVVAGASMSGANGHAARFTYGVAEDLGVIPGGSISSGTGINDSGVVTGDSEYSVNGGAIRHATLFKNGTAIDLGSLPLAGNYSRGNSINNSEVVVGHSGFRLSTSNTRAFIWDAANGMRDIGDLGGGWAKALAINDANQVTGTSTVPTGLSPFQAFIWDQTNGMRPIPTVAGDTSSGNAINANGHVAGTSTINNFDNRQHAFLWDGTTTRDLGAIGDNDFYSDRSYAAGINIHDEVVGGTYRPYDGGTLYPIPFLYKNGQMYELARLIDASGADYGIFEATGINDAGQITVQARRISTNQTRAVLLTPNIVVSGRLTARGQRGLRAATVTLTASNGETYSAVTGGMGRFSIQNVPAGLTYTVTVASRRFTFAATTIRPMADANLQLSAN